MPQVKKVLFRRFIWALTAIFLLPLVLPPSSSAMTIKEERELGEKVLAAIKSRYPLVNDPAANQYVTAIGKRILQTMEPQPFDYEFFIINTPDVNAFAVPGGKLFLNSGIILLMENEDELAGVMSHEIGHVVARHISKREEKGQIINLATLGLILAGIFLGAKAGSAIATTTVAAAETAFLKYSREDEDEADYLGAKFMERAGYNRKNMITMLKKIRLMSGPASSDPPAYLLTHPAVEERIAGLDIQFGRYPDQLPGKKPVGNLHRVQTKLVASEKDTARSVTYFENFLKRKPEDPEGFLGLGLTQKRLGALDRAIENLAKAASLLPQDGEIHRELGTTYLLKGNLAEAQDQLEKARDLSPSDPLTYFYLGRVYGEQKMADQSLQAFLRTKELNPNLPELYYHLGLAYGNKNMLGHAYLNLGLHYKIAGDPKTALAQFNKALSYFPDSSPERQTLLKEIESLSPKKTPQKDSPKKRKDF